MMLPLAPTSRVREANVKGLQFCVQYALRSLELVKLRVLAFVSMPENWEQLFSKHSFGTRCLYECP